MDVKKLFEGVNTDNIDIDKIEKLEKREPIYNDVTAKKFKIEYDSFYNEKKIHLFKSLLKSNSKEIPLVGNLGDIICIPSNDNNDKIIDFVLDNENLIEIDDIIDFVDNNYLNDKFRHKHISAIKKLKQKRQKRKTPIIVPRCASSRKVLSFKISKTSKKRFMSRKNHIYDNLQLVIEGNLLRRVKRR